MVSLDRGPVGPRRKVPPMPVHIMVIKSLYWFEKRRTKNVGNINSENVQHPLLKVDF